MPLSHWLDEATERLTMIWDKLFGSLVLIKFRIFLWLENTRELGTSSYDSNQIMCLIHVAVSHRGVCLEVYIVYSIPF